MKPDNTCGSCPVWLAALEGDGLDNWDSIFEACRKQGCFSTPTEALSFAAIALIGTSAKIKN